MTWLMSKWAAALALAAGLLAGIAAIFYKGKASGKRAEQARQEEAAAEARKRMDHDKAQVDDMSDSDLDDQLRR